MNDLRCLSFVLSALLLISYGGAASGEDESIVIASKKFTESVILGEIIKLQIADAGVAGEHVRELGGTRILWSALLKGDIDIYPEYTGTIIQEILAKENIQSPGELPAALAKHGVGMSAPLGFNNTYILGMIEARAQSLNITRISDLARHPELKFGFSEEFMDRGDGWPGLQARYGLPQTDVRGLDHDLAYRGLESADLDVIDLYSTDAEIEYYGIRSLRDDRNYFPEYQAVILYRADLPARRPGVVAALNALAGRIDAARMVSMNAAVKLSKHSEHDVAAAFFNGSELIAKQSAQTGQWSRFKKHTLEHLVLVGISLSAAIIIAIPLGILAARRRGIGQVILGVAGIMQTIPALALLVFMIPLFGIGGGPAIVALFLYSLLPIIRNTYSGLHDIPAPLRESAIALGLSNAARLRLIELPLAARSILAGIKTAAVINIGTATLGALIGAGGYGQPILTGIRLDDTVLILEGAVPAALLAVAVQLSFDLLERVFVSRGLRMKTQDL